MDPKARLIEIIATLFLFLVIGLNFVNPVLSSLTPYSIAGALILLTYMGSSISGAHFNPAVTIGVYIRKVLGWNELLSYLVAQIFGVVLALVPLYFLSELPSLSENGFIPAKIFAAEYLFTFLLVLTYLMVSSNIKAAGNSYFGIAIGLVYFVGIAVVGSISGAVLNPAVALGLAVVRYIPYDQLGFYLLAEILAGLSAGFLSNYLLEE